MSIFNPLTHTQLYEQAPSLFAQEPYFEASDKYHFIPTIDVITKITGYGWHPVFVQEASVRDVDKEGYQRHFVRFRHFDDLINPTENAVELLLFNSHDRTTAFSISVGIYRFVCANGLVIANSVFKSYKIKHIGDRDNDVATAIEHISKIKPLLQQKIYAFESILLNDREKLAFAKASIPLRFDEHLNVNISDLLISHRKEDKKDDLYTTLNVIQENLIRGNISGINKETGRHFTSKEISSIRKDVDINQGLWSIAENIANIKEPSLSLAA